MTWATNKGFVDHSFDTLGFADYSTVVDIAADPGSLAGCSPLARCWYSALLFEILL